MQAFYQTHFVPAEATLIVVGDVEVAPFLEQLRSTWSGWRGKKQTTERPVAQPDRDERTIYVVDKPGAVQSILSVGRIWRGRGDPTYFATDIGNRVLGGDFLSRINQNLRERKGYTYGARSLFRYRREGSDWLVLTSVDRKSTRLNSSHMSESRMPSSA